eukprot:20367-Pyramimonas_sp.AAC.1
MFELVHQWSSRLPRRCPGRSGRSQILKDASGPGSARSQLARSTFLRPPLFAAQSPRSTCWNAASAVISSGRAQSKNVVASIFQELFEFRFQVYASSTHAAFRPPLFRALAAQVGVAGGLVRGSALDYLPPSLCLL